MRFKWVWVFKQYHKAEKMGNLASFFSFPFLTFFIYFFGSFQPIFSVYYYYYYYFIKNIIT